MFLFRIFFSNRFVILITHLILLLGLLTAVVGNTLMQDRAFYDQRQDMRDAKPDNNQQYGLDIQSPKKPTIHHVDHQEQIPGKRSLI